MLFFQDKKINTKDKKYSAGDIKIIFPFLICVFYFCSFIFYFCAIGATPSELKQSIDQKNKELTEINEKIKASQKILESTQGQSRTLQKELDIINSNINQLNLSIRSSEITIERLELEIDSLGYDIADTEGKINIEKEATAKILRQLQQKDGENVLMILLKNNSLAESVFETQSLADLNGKLIIEINNLKDLKNTSNNKLDETSKKKQGIELENQNLKNRKAIVEDQKTERQKLLSQTKNQEKIYQQQASELEKRQSEIAAEIEKIEEELRTKIDPNLLPQLRPGVLAMPTNGIISQEYGATAFAKYTYKSKWHNGIDIAASLGTPVFAAEEGKIVAIGNQDRYCYRGAYGKFIVIEHKNNLTTLYAHLSLQAVKEGDSVKRGDLIGYVGKTGWATGPHLHFTVFAGNTFVMEPSKYCGLMPVGGDLNPLGYL